MVQVVQIDARIIKRYFALRIPRIDRRLLAMKACVSQQFSTPNRLKYSYLRASNPLPLEVSQGQAARSMTAPYDVGLARHAEFAVQPLFSAQGSPLSAPLQRGSFIVGTPVFSGIPGPVDGVSADQWQDCGAVGRLGRQLGTSHLEQAASDSPDASDETITMKRRTRVLEEHISELSAASRACQGRRPALGHRRPRSITTTSHRTCSSIRP